MQLSTSLGTCGVPCCDVYGVVGVDGGYGGGRGLASGGKGVGVGGRGGEEGGCGGVVAFGGACD